METKNKTKFDINKTVNKYLRNATSNDVYDITVYLLNFFEDNNVELIHYNNLLKKLCKICSKDKLKNLILKNKKLLLAYCINNMSNKPLFDKISLDNYKIDSRYTEEQKKAIKSNSKLSLITAGAGCGKSTVIIERIKYLKAMGIPEDDILVLSFTNAAANNIKNKYPNCNSMTISTLMNYNYNNTFKFQEISYSQTLINTLDMIYKNTKLSEVLSENNMMKLLNYCASRPLELITKVLNSVRQVSLELQTAISIQYIDEINDLIKAKHIIIDEMQDNSIYDFIYVMKYAKKYNASVFMVGDASQTLYEFREADPNAINMIEASKVFELFKLTTNFRSNQKILDFGNEVLKEIKANKYSQIQLNALETKENLLKNKTHDDFITVTYHQDDNIKEFRNNLENYLYDLGLIKEIKNLINKGKTVAVLTETGYTLQLIENYINKRFKYDNDKVMNLIPTKEPMTSIFSGLCVNDEFLQTKDTIKQINNKIFTLNSNIDNYGQKLANQRVLNEFNQIMNTDLMKFDLAYKDNEMYDQKLKSKLINYEIKRNKKLMENCDIIDAENKNLIFSTIHSAKGLEFDHVFIFFNVQNEMDEDKKRKLYVGLTRAKESEHLICFDTIKHPNIITVFNSLKKGE